MLATGISSLFYSFLIKEDGAMILITSLLQLDGSDEFLQNLQKAKISCLRLPLYIIHIPCFAMASMC